MTTINEISVREQMIQKAIELLKPVIEPMGATVHRSPSVALQREDLPALVIFPEKDELKAIKNLLVERELTIRVVALSHADGISAAETLADKLSTAAHATLMENHNLGGLCQKIVAADCEWNIEEADGAVGEIPARYVISYHTLLKDISSTVQRSIA